MLVSLIVVSLILGNDSVQGESKVASAEERDVPRVKFFGGLGGTAIVAHSTAGVMPGLRLEMGRMFSDRFGLSALLDLSTRIYANVLLAGGTFSWVATDWLALSGGLALGVGGPYPFPEADYFSQLLVVPLLAEVFVEPRAPSEVARKGVMIGLMVAPGISRLQGQLSGSFVVSLSIGYAVW